MNFVSPAAWMLLLTIPLPLQGANAPRKLPVPGRPLFAAEDTLQDPRVEVRSFSMKVDVKLVTVDAIVRDRQGSAVTNLRADNFVVQDNGAEQKITYFSRDVLPLAVALVIDRSPSIRPYLEDLRNAALSALRGLKPVDRVVLFAFDKCPRRLSDLTADRLQISHRINSIEIGSDTDIHAAVCEAARFLRQQAPDGRRAIVLISDNSSDKFRLDENDALREMLEASAALFSIRTPGLIPPSATDLKAIERIANETGGEVLKLGRPDRLAPALDQAISNLRAAYTLGFTPQNAGEDESFHRLSVKLDTGRSCPGCRVQARTRYFFGTRRTQQDGAGQPYSCEEIAADISARRAVLIAAHAQNEIDLIPFSVRTETIDAADGELQIRVTLGIDRKYLGFNSPDENLPGALVICVLYTDTRGRMLGQEWKTVDPQEMSSIDFRQGIQLTITIPLKEPRQTLKVIVYDVLSRKVGSRILKMK
jgi:VWFA-related protein